LFRPSGDGLFKASNGRLQGDRESRVAADEIGPFEFGAESMAFARYFDGLGRQSNDIFLSLDRERTFKCLIERSHVILMK